MNNRFILSQSSIPGLWLAERKVVEDNRGVFSKLFCAEEFLKAGINKPIVQINHSVTRKKGTVRGLHFQYPPHAETRIISCLKGAAFDVAVDLRKNSKTFLSWHGEKLSPENRKSLIVPEGFAHGFQALTDDCELIYLHTGFYLPESEGGFNAADKRIAVDWPLPVAYLSERDKTLPFLNDAYDGITS
jgi:dTDP-4-dehydrorhamnose 3,5-epimerase